MVLEDEKLKGYVKVIIIHIKFHGRASYFRSEISLEITNMNAVGVPEINRIFYEYQCILLRQFVKKRRHFTA